MRKRFGKFTLSYELIEKSPMIAKDIMGQCIIHRTDMEPGKGYTYWAECDRFDFVNVGDMAPTYEAKLHFDTKKKEFTSWMFIRTKKIDHKSMLKRYINLIVDLEGVDFTNETSIFTEEEIEEMNKMVE